jgi:hypothetical protein
MAKLSRRQRETIIVFNELDSEATVFTYNRKWKERLAKLGMKAMETNSFGGATFEVPKKSIHMPVIRKRKALTADQKKTIRERLVAGRKAKAEGTNDIHKRQTVKTNKSKKNTESVNQQTI